MGGDSEFWGWGGTGLDGGGQPLDGVGSDPIVDNPGTYGESELFYCRKSSAKSVVKFL